MPTILSARGGLPSARNLAAVLGINAVVETAERHDWLIRWGSAAAVRLRPENVINSRAAVSAATDKLQSLRTFSAVGIPTPEVFEGIGVPSEALPVLGRRVTHTRGLDIMLCMNPPDVNMARAGGSNYFVRYIPVTREFRVHVYKNQVVKVSEKLLRDQEAYTRPWVRNFDNGYRFHNPRPLDARTETQLHVWSIAALRSLNLDFGAVDVILDANHNPHVLEVNTAPALSRATCQVYASSIARDYGGTVNMEAFVADDATPEDEGEDEPDGNED